MQLMEVFSRAYRAQFNKMTEEETNKMAATFKATFDHHPDNVIIEAAAVAVRRNDFIPSLQEFDECIRRAGMILENRRINEQKRKEREAEVYANSPTLRASLWEDALKMVGLSEQDAHRTAWNGLEQDKIGGAT